MPGRYGLQGEKGVHGEILGASPGQAGDQGLPGLQGIKGQTGDNGDAGYPGMPCLHHTFLLFISWYFCCF